MPEQRRFDALLAPRRIFLLLAVAVLIALLFAPFSAADDEAGTLSSYSATPGGARGLHELLDRLGLDVRRRLEPMRDSLDPNAVYLVLEPSVPLTASEVHRLLQAVRGGARLLAVPSLQSRLADSLRVARAPELPRNTSPPAGERGAFLAQDSTRSFGPGWVRWVLRGPGDDEDAPYLPPENATVLLSLDTENGPEPMVVGMPFGNGRLVVAAEPGLFRNSTLRVHPGAIRAVRYLEWLDAGGNATIVFDEYHHGHGTHANVLREAGRALTATLAGRAVLQVALAGLLFLIAAGVRPILPRPITRIERRSPLEHVGALARAYAAINATARATRLLVRGLQRRHHGIRAGDEMAWLAAIGRQLPSVQPEVERLRAIITASAEAGSADEVVASVSRIERALQT